MSVEVIQLLRLVIRVCEEDHKYFISIIITASERVSSPFSFIYTAVHKFGIYFYIFLERKKYFYSSTMH